MPILLFLLIAVLCVFFFLESLDEQPQLLLILFYYYWASQSGLFSYKLIPLQDCDFLALSQEIVNHWDGGL